MSQLEKGAWLSSTIDHSPAENHPERLCPSTAKRPSSRLPDRPLQGSAGYQEKWGIPRPRMRGAPGHCNRWLVPGSLVTLALARNRSPACGVGTCKFGPTGAAVSCGREIQQPSYIIRAIDGCFATRIIVNTG